MKSPTFWIERLYMTSTVWANKHRPNQHRLFAPGEQQMLKAELGRDDDPSRSMHWRLLLKLAIETGASPADLASAEWNQFDKQHQLWTIPRSRQGKRYGPKPIVLTRKGTRIMRILHMLADSNSQRVFHSLPLSPLGLSIRFGYAATRAGLIDFCLRDFLAIAIARRVAASPGTTAEQIAWSLGFRYGQTPKAIRAYITKS